MAPSVYAIDPLADPRWPAFLSGHPQASVFHTTEWLRALQRTYGYQPVAFTTSPAGIELENGWVFCRIDSWVTGRRLVSLPFSDHCQPLVARREDAGALYGELERLLPREKCRYVEFRPRDLLFPVPVSNVGAAGTRGFCFHALDLQPGLETLFGKFHKSCVQRKIQRAEREQLAYEEGRSESLIAKFYHLLALTRRRHQLPPQPRAWFRELADCFGGRLSVRVASKDDRPIASILTLSFRNTLVYKWGCSDAAFHKLGAMPFLFWKAIQEAKRLGATQFDLGRTDLDNAGLIAFKDHSGAEQSRLTYYRYPQPAFGRTAPPWTERLAKKAVGCMPDLALRVVGNLLYRHVG